MNVTEGPAAGSQNIIGCLTIMLPTTEGNIMGRLDMKFYIHQLRRRYHQGKKSDKELILDEFCKTSGIHRKHAIRLFNRSAPEGWREHKFGPKYKYKVIEEPLKTIWLASDQMCSKRLKAAIPLWLPAYEAKYGILDESARQKLLTISPSTIDRVLLPLRSKYRRKYCGTKPGGFLKKHVPIKTNQWNEKVPGFVEADSVAHCGNSLSGNFIWSITVTDIFSGWTENAAVWCKGAHNVCTEIKGIEERLPFPLLGFDSDNGNEFLNHHLLKYFQDRKSPIQFTRSRPYHSGDNAHVEQKNWTHVRQIFGYNRLDNSQLVPYINDLYRNELSLFHNYFCPAMKLVDKIREFSKTKKKYDTPKTPHQRLLESEHVDSLLKEKLNQVFGSLNPFDLQKTIQNKLRYIFKNIDLNLKKKVS